MRDNIFRLARLVFGALLIVLGIVSVVTPFTPFAWLGVVGLVLVFGKERTWQGVRYVANLKLFRPLGLAKLADKVEQRLKIKKNAKIDKGNLER